MTEAQMPERLNIENFHGAGQGNDMSESVPQISAARIRGMSEQIRVDISDLRHHAARILECSPNNLVLHSHSIMELARRIERNTAAITQENDELTVKLEKMQAEVDRVLVCPGCSEELIPLNDMLAKARRDAFDVVVRHINSLIEPKATT